MDSWRLIRSAPADGFTNMAVDEAILIAHSQGHVPPTVRLYAWEPPAISTGYFQRVAHDVDLDACARAGIGVVRRLTGGRAVLHADEVTYSVVVAEAGLQNAAASDGIVASAPFQKSVRGFGPPNPPSSGGLGGRTPYEPVNRTTSPTGPTGPAGLMPPEEPPEPQIANCKLQIANCEMPAAGTGPAPGGAAVMAAYRMLSGGLIAGLARLGVEAWLAPGQRPLGGPAGADCFAAAAQCDLVARPPHPADPPGEVTHHAPHTTQHAGPALKICGSAQVRRQGVILQHGALPLALRVAAPYWRQAGAPPHATDLERLLGRRPTWEEVAEALAAGFAEALSLPLVAGELTSEERALSEQLRREKYATDAWNLRR